MFQCPAVFPCFLVCFRSFTAGSFIFGPGPWLPWPSLVLAIPQLRLAPMVNRSSQGPVAIFFMDGDFMNLWFMDIYGCFWWIFDGFVGDPSFPIRGFSLDGVLVKSCASSHSSSSTTCRLKHRCLAAGLGFPMATLGTQLMTSLFVSDLAATESRTAAAIPSAF